MKRIVPALVVAVLAHAGIGVGVARVRPPAGSPSAAMDDAPPMELALEEARPPAPWKVAAVAHGAETNDPGAPRARETDVRRSPSEAPRARGSRALEAPAAPVASVDPFAPVDLGADRARRARDALAGLAAGTGLLPIPRGEAPRSDAPTPMALPDLAARAKRSITDGLDARDRSLGLGAAGVVANAAHAAMTGPEAPREGSATIQLRLDAEGRVVSARVAASRGGPWGPLLAVLRAELARRRLPVPTTSAGVMVAVRVEARLQLPSASDHRAGPAVSLDGGRVGGPFDLADLAAKPTRVVSARVVTQVRL